MSLQLVSLHEVRTFGVSSPFSILAVPGGDDLYVRLIILLPQFLNSVTGSGLTLFAVIVDSGVNDFICSSKLPMGKALSLDR